MFATTPPSELHPHAGVIHHAEDLKPRWFAAYTRSRHEKRVAEQLEQRRTEFFLPLYRTVHRWKDRRMRVELPLFPGYIFVRIAQEDRRWVLQVPGLVRLVGFNGLPTTVPDADIEALRNGLENQINVEPHPYLKVGRCVRIRSGPLRGAEGILVRKKGVFRVVLSIDLILRSMAVEVDTADVDPIDKLHRILPGISG